LPEDRRPVPGLARSAINGDSRSEGEFGPRKNANRRVRIAGRRKSPGTGAEISGSQLLAYARRSRFDMHQTVVAHLALLLCLPADTSNARTTPKVQSLEVAECRKRRPAGCAVRRSTEPFSGAASLYRSGQLLWAISCARVLPHRQQG